MVEAGLGRLAQALELAELELSPDGSNGHEKEFGRHAAVRRALTKHATEAVDALMLDVVSLLAVVDIAHLIQADKAPLMRH